MQSDNFPLSWPFESLLNPTIDQSYSGLNMGFYFDDQSSEISHFSTIFPCNDQFQDPLEGLQSMLIDGIHDIYNCLDDSEALSSRSREFGSPSASTISSEGSTLTMPGEAMQIDDQLSVFHLLKAYAEAIEKDRSELAEVILRSVGKKANPMFPYWRFAHFASNSAILEAVPNDADVVHIVDFDIGEGIQWPPVIEAMGWKQKSMRLTLIRWGDDDTGRSPWRFDDTMGQLCDHARSFGVNLKMEEMGIHDLVNELKMRKRGVNREWLAFNCTVGIGKHRSRKIVNEFLNIAKDYVSRHKGIITFGDGDAYEKPKDCSEFATFFDDQLTHYQAVLESMESGFAKHLLQARMKMECLFIGPNICGQAWLQHWKEMNEARHFNAGNAIEGFRVGSERLLEAQEIVRERDNLYEVTIGGDSENELALEWRGITLARGLKKHLKRLNAPRHWMLDKLGGAFAPKPSSGPHKSRECLPLILILRNRLKYALTYREVIAILMQRHVMVDGKVRTDKTYPAGFMDVVSIPKTNEDFRLLYDTKGRFRLHAITGDETKFKLCKVRSVQFGQKGIPYLNTYDGRTIRYPDPLVKANDTIKLDLESNKIVDFIKFDVGNVVMVTGGRNRGRVGVIKNREKHKGSFETIHVQDVAGHEFATRLGNVFTIGKGTKPWVSLPKGKGIKLSIIEEARKRLAAQNSA
ncbi:40S ribosomal protein S4 [Hibiscus syriacus]|uniref:40S ribosomal protein S4 n=1 Tax=Hibiscus syriacus TaxID=106335 RepID=A0A6A3A069_HIBSY|nr:40S ribosomal protein S4 [Hibiscus syriacus]